MRKGVYTRIVRNFWFCVKTEMCYTSEEFFIHAKKCKGVIHFRV